MHKNAEQHADRRRRAWRQCLVLLWLAMLVLLALAAAAVVIAAYRGGAAGGLTPPARAGPIPHRLATRRRVAVHRHTPPTRPFQQPRPAIGRVPEIHVHHHWQV
jgi:hypothetical protein